jgi:hypothetical protein
MIAEVSKNDSTILVKMPDNKPMPLFYLHENKWRNIGSTTFEFKEKENSFSELRIDQVYGFYILRKEK